MSLPPPRTPGTAWAMCSCGGAGSSSERDGARDAEGTCPTCPHVSHPTGSPGHGAPLTRASGGRRCCRGGRGAARSSGTQGGCIASSRRSRGPWRCLWERVLAGGVLHPKTHQVGQGWDGASASPSLYYLTGDQSSHVGDSHPKTTISPLPRDAVLAGAPHPATGGDSPGFTVSPWF